MWDVIQPPFRLTFMFAFNISGHDLTFCANVGLIIILQDQSYVRYTLKYLGECD